MGHHLGRRRRSLRVSRVHPKYKTKYRVSNWTEYDRVLVQRGAITLWVSENAIASWKPAPIGLRNAQRKFSDHAIETALTLRLVFDLPLRQAEGFLRSVLSLMSIDLEAPDHTTLSRRSQSLNVDLHRVADNKPIHLIDMVEGDIASFTADAAYDTSAIYNAAATREARVVVPPIKSATKPRRKTSNPCARDRTIMRVREIGRRLHLCANAGREVADESSDPDGPTK